MEMKNYYLRRAESQYHVEIAQGPGWDKNESVQAKNG